MTNQATAPIDPRPTAPAVAPPAGAGALFHEHRQRVYRETDRLFAKLMMFQWLAGIAAACFVSPWTWVGDARSVHPHVWVAVVLGGLTNLFPATLALLWPGRPSTRYAISAGQVLTSGLLIHLTGGRLETHFHVFGSLAFLSFYRDWRVLIPATVVTAADHYLRGALFPQSVYGVLAASQWRWLEHAGWVVFEDVILVAACVRSRREMRDIAERTADADRHNAELKATRDTALDCVITMDHSGRVTEFNPAAERTFGYARAAAVGRPLADLIIPPADRAAHAAEMSRYLGTGTGTVVGRRVEVPAVRADGSGLPVELAISCVRLSGPPIFVAYLRDITERKRAEEQARHAEKLSLVASRTDNAVIITDARGHIEWVNEGFRRVSGYTLAEVAGRKPGSFLQGPETSAETVAHMRAHLARGEGFTAEVMNYGKDGRKYWLAVEVQPIHDADGTLRQFMAVETDVTERKRMEAEVRESRERFELAVRGANDGLWDLDVTTGRAYFSPRWFGQLGYGEGELPGHLSTLEQLVHPDDLDRVSRAVADAQAGGTPDFAAEFRMRHKDGSHRWILSRGVTVRDPAGRAVRMAGCHTDVTERRRAAEALVRARDEAEAASRAKSEFLANMSHEIRTPLNGVIGMAELLVRRGGLGEQQRRHAQVIKSSADALLALINDVLDFSKIEAGKLELSCVDFDLRQVVEDVVEMLAPKASAKGLEFACDLHPGVARRLHGDPDRIRQILINLANNAIKFTDRGEVVIRVQPADDVGSAPGERVGTGGGLALKFSVRDTGVGIPADRVQRLFKSFSQVDSSTTRKYGGTGLGLAIAKQLAELMGGRVGVESEVGRGSTFWFTARLRPPAEGEPARPPAPTAPTLRGLRVLAVDDHAAYREILREQLSEWGFEVDVAAGGAEALRLLAAAAAGGRPYRVAVVDLVMPGMGGDAVAHAVRSDPQLAGRTTLLMLTSMDNPYDPAEMRQAGFAACLAKPVRQSQLFDAIVEAVAVGATAGGPGSTGGRPATGGFSSSSGVGASPSGDAATSQVRSLSGLRVLLAEDNEVNQEVARELLADAGCSVDVVPNGLLAVRAVVESAGRRPYDVVLMDCQMPEMDGFGATLQIRQMEVAAGGPRLPIVALTANAFEGDRQRCLAAGMDAFVTKPVDPEALVETIRSVARAAPAAGATETPSTAATAVDAVQAGPRVEARAEADDKKVRPPIDAGSLLNRCQGKSSLAERLLGKFEQQLAAQVDALRQSLDRQDREVLTRVAHTVKGTAANMSAEPLREAAAELERFGAAAEFDAAVASLERLAAEARQCLDYVPAAVEQVRLSGGSRPAARPSAA
ncbi:MAG: hybrid sensor histidine kinase/response regulator [Phycisphaerales bacterium]|nr:hybrid sensor histidine kinase/response regulator [Phycisphaerales bacterium]